MKGLISGIKRMEIHDGDGIRTTVFFKGCPLKCIWCHNPESISFEKQVAFFKEKCINCGLCNGEKSKKNAANCPVNAMIMYCQEYTVDELVEVLLKDSAFFKASGGGILLRRLDAFLELLHLRRNLGPLRRPLLPKLLLRELGGLVV